MLFGCVCMADARRTVARSDVFVQARLAETGLGSYSSSRSGGELSF